MAKEDESSPAKSFRNWRGSPRGVLDETERLIAKGFPVSVDNSQLSELGPNDFGVMSGEIGPPDCDDVDP